MNNNYYGLEDFVETINLVGIKRAEIELVLKAWGDSNGGSKESPGTELSFGAVLKLKDGRFAYVTGWNDYTGWGCQDGVNVRYAETIEGLDLPKTQEYDKDPITWDESPIDLNEWLQGKRKTFYD